MELVRGPHTPVKVLKQVEGGYLDITSGLDLIYRQTDGVWEMVLISSVPLTGIILF